MSGLIIGATILILSGCQFGNGFSLGPRSGLFGIPVEFSKHEKKPQPADSLYENMPIENQLAMTSGQSTGGVNAESGWLGASDAPSAEQWYAAAGPDTSASQTENRIEQVSYTPRELKADDQTDLTNGTQGISHAAVTAETQTGGVTQAYQRGSEVPVPLTQDNWVVNLELERFNNGKSDQRPESPWRWRHRGIEEILILPPDRQPNWSAMLQHDDPIVRGNTLVILARNGDTRVGNALFDLINDVSCSRAMRCAAVEAVGSLDSTHPETLVQLADTYYDYIDASGNRKGGVPELAVEILHAMSRKMPISNEPHFVRPLESRDAKVRLTAVCIWRDHAFDVNKMSNISNLDGMPSRQQGRAMLPEIVVQYCGDSNTVMQEAALSAVARWRHPQAMPCLDLGLRSPKASVRCAAIRGLADMQTDEATALLLTLANDQSAAIRAEVVVAMGRLNLFDNVLRMSDDPDWSVRKAVARELAKSDNPRARAIAQKYLYDPSTQVQTTTLESLKNWHPESAAPLLFEAMGGNALETRNQAAEMLVKYWEPAREYVPNARTELRKQRYEQLTAQFQRDMQTGALQASIARVLRENAAQQLQTRTQHETQNDQSQTSQPPQQLAWQLPQGQQVNQPEQQPFGNMTPNRTPQRQPANDIRVDENRVRALLTQLQQAGTQQQHHNAAVELANMGPGLLPSLERIAIAEGHPLPPVVYRQVLPGLDSLFDISAKLENNDPNMRRAAVAELVGETKFGDVSPLLYRQLTDHSARENDEIVLQRLWDFADQHANKLAQLDVEWQGNASQNGAMQRYQEMLANSLAAFRKNLTAGSLAHASPELHRRVCTHLLEHGRAEDVPALLAELNHPSTSVSRAALQALAKLGSIEHAANVRPLLTHPQPLVAVDAALALDRWGDPAGTNALERLAVSGDRTTKLAVVQGIKKSVDRKYVPILIRLLDESGTIRQESLDALPLAAGRDVVPPQELAYYSTQERVALWKQWNNRGQVF